MLSRVAEEIYWMARYIERAEDMARLIMVNTHLLMDLPRRVRLGWEPIIEIVGGHDLFYSQYDEATEQSVIRFIVTDSNNPSSIFNSLNMARDNARTTRDTIPREAWEQVNQLFLTAKGDAQSILTQRHRFDCLKRIILGAQTITGMLAGTMTHDEGYDFLRMGRNLERADMTTRLIDVRSASLLPEMAEDLAPFETIQWISVLKSLTGYQMYRREMRSRVHRADVLKFLLQEQLFPRSFYHALNEVKSCLQHLPHHEQPLKALLQLQRKVTHAKPHALTQDELHHFIDVLQLGLGKVHNQISASYF